MVRGYGLGVLAAFVALVGSLGLWAPVAQAQFIDPSEKMVTLESQGTDVRDMIRVLFRQVGVDYSIGPEVQGTVYLQMTGVRFETALQALLRQVGATYRVEGGIYQIISRDDLANKPNFAPVSAAVITQDGRFLYILRGDLLYKVNKSDLKTVTIRRLGE